MRIGSVAWRALVRAVRTSPGGMNAGLAAAVLVLLVLPGIATADDDAFSKTWYDGKAELSGYKLTIERYGEQREGTCVLIYVTEPFSSTDRVKANDASSPDVFNALKLNMVRDFQTGIYDYNTMSSVFVHDDDFKISKTSFTSAEWCGHVYEEMLFYDDKVKGHYYSYFQGESGPIEYTPHDGGVVEESLWILLRGLRGDYMKPGSTKDIMILPGALRRRLEHSKPGWVGARLSRRKTGEAVTVPAGTFDVFVYELQTFDGRKGAFYVESDYPHRIVRWSMPPDVEAVMAGSKRLSYWKLNHNGNESYLKEIGLR